ncbi:programmed cell death 1 ligand 1-like [Alosa pseudoharengus]|uniref:programmed cell death 1 ligand 1-like n=1 Tax=Alosa pseudoharengus TaxID=34774 RepID=UPI003F8BCF87
MQTPIIACLCLLSVLSFSSGNANNMYDVVLNEHVTLTWNVSTELDIKNDVVVILRSEDVDVIHLVKGRPKVFPAFDGRVQVLTDGFPRGVVALKMDNISIQDSGEYRCLVHKPLNKRPELCHLKVRAPWGPVCKSNVSMDNGVYSLVCETEGYPLAHVIWTDGLGQNLTDRAKLTTSLTSDKRYHISSRLNVSISTSGNYSCTVTDDRGVSQHKTFVFPDKAKSRHHYFMLSLLILCGLTVVVLIVKYQRSSPQ